MNDLVSFLNVSPAFPHHSSHTHAYKTSTSYRSASSGFCSTQFLLSSPISKRNSSARLCGTNFKNISGGSTRKLPLKSTNQTQLFNLKSIQIVQTEEQLNACINNSSFTLVKVSAPWCRACKSMIRPYEKISREYSEEIQCLEINVEESDALMQSLGIRSLPTFIIYRHGKRIDHFNAKNHESLKEHILDYI